MGSVDIISTGDTAPLDPAVLNLDTTVTEVPPPIDAVAVSITTDIGAADVNRALAAHFPGEGATVSQDDDGVVSIVFDNSTRVLADAEAALAAWSAGAAMQVRAQKLAVQALQARRAAAIASFAYLGHPVPITTDLKADVSAAIQDLTARGSGSIQWEIADGVYTAMDLAALTAFGTAAAAFVEAAFANSKAINDAITAAVDQAGLDAIDLEAGWPT